MTMFTPGQMYRGYHILGIDSRRNADGLPAVYVVGPVGGSPRDWNEMWADTYDAARTMIDTAIEENQ